VLLDGRRAESRADWPGPEETRAASLAPALLVLVAALLGFTLLRQGTDFVATQEPAHVWLWSALVGLLAAAFLPARYADMPVVGRRGLKAGTAFLAFYFLVEPFAIPYAALEPGHPAVLFHQHARWAGLALALAGFWRPSPVFAAAMVLWMMRELQTALTGFYFSTLDIRNVAEVASFWAIGFTFIASGARLSRVREAIGLHEPARYQAALMILGAGLGAHLANYFWSAMAKLWLDGGPTSWLLGNRLYDGIPAALEKGTLPLAAFPAAVVALDFALRWLAIPINLAAWIVQLSAIVAPWRRRWLIASVVAFDMFHLAVWFSLGLLFWKWVALNMIILFTVAAVRDAEWGRTVKVTTFVFTVAGIGLFRTATLAWYESPGFASPYFVAEMKDGTRQRIPNAFFLSSSYQVSQGRIWWPGEAGHFHHSIWGSVLPHADLEAGRTCTPPEYDSPPEPLYGPPEAIGRFMQAQHRQMLARADDKGHATYYLVPHHHVPSPLIPDPFARADLRQVARYAFVLDSVCLSLDGGKLKRRVLKRTYRPVYDAVNDRVLP